MGYKQYYIMGYKQYNIMGYKQYNNNKNHYNVRRIIKPKPEKNHLHDSRGINI
jgi:hypothetical protein